MAKKKYYAVKKGYKTGVFDNWTDCQSAISGYSNAEYKGFATEEEANQYLEGNKTPLFAKASLNDDMSTMSDRLIAYVDGSYDDSLKKYAFGCVFLTPSGDTIKESGNGENPASLAIRNVAGEMLGAMFAVKWAIANGYPEIEIRYDYEGIEKWVEGDWKAKNELAIKYTNAMNEWKKSIRIFFSKVAAHSNNKYNDMADELAKAALIEGKGIPPIKKGDYWFTAEKISRSDVSAIIDLMKDEFLPDMVISEGIVAHGVSYALSLSKKDKISIHHYDNGKLMVQGKPKSLFSSIITYVTCLSNFVISLLKNVIPKAVRLPCFIVIIAGFVTLIEFLMKGYIPELYSALGVFLSLITVNCIILGRAEAFASKNKIFPSVLDGLGMGLGFTLSLFTMGSIREILGTGSWFGFKIPFLCDDPMTVFIMPAGGFFVLGCLIALVNKIANKKPPKEISCSGCPNAALCKGQCRTESEEA